MKTIHKRRGSTGKAGKKSRIPIKTKSKVAEKEPRKRRAAPKKPTERVTPEEEQDILTRFSRGETLRKVEGVYRRKIRGEIRNLRKAFEAGEFVSKDGVWQLAS